MRRMLPSLGVALALTAGIIAPACAGGDWGYGNGVNPYGAVTPVPAPVWVPVYDRWYFRSGSRLRCPMASPHRIERWYGCRSQQFRNR